MPTRPLRCPIMRILVLGGDGYLGWPTAMYLSARGHEVSVVDNGSRRRWHHEHSTGRLVPIESLAERIKAWQELSGEQIRSFIGDLRDADFTLRTILASPSPRRSCTSPSSARRRTP